MSSINLPVPAETSQKAVNISAIERELDQLMTQPFNPDAPEATSWARMSNLVIFCSTEEELNRVTAEVGFIVRFHPSRVLVVVGDTSKSAGSVEAYISASCHLLGGGKKCCSEHVTLSAGGSATRRLPYMVRSLLLGDLPTDLWWAHHEPPSLGGDLFFELAGMAHQVIYESFRWPNPTGGVVSMGKWAANPDVSQTISDLGWRKLKPWRRLLGQSLDPGILPGALENITEVVVDHGPHMLPQVWLLIGWAACRLNWQPAGGKVVPGETLTWRFRSPRGPVSITARRHADLPSEINHIGVTWKSGLKPITADFAVAGAHRLSVAIRDADVPPRFLMTPFQSRSLLVAKQLPDRERDPLLDQTMQLARMMAESLV